MWCCIVTNVVCILTNQTWRRESGGKPYSRSMWRIAERVSQIAIQFRKDIRRNGITFDTATIPGSQSVENPCRYETVEPQTRSVCRRTVVTPGRAIVACSVRRFSSASAATRRVFSCSRQQ